MSKDVDHATASAILTSLRGLPEEYMPTEEFLTALVDSHMVLSNPSYERTPAVAAVVRQITQWYHRFGKRTALNLIQATLINKAVVVVRRKEDGSREGNGGSEGEPGNFSGAAGLFVGEQPEAEGELGSKPFNPQGLRVVEGLGGEGAASRDRAAEPAQGSVRSKNGGSGEGLSRRLVELELSEHRIDLQVFKKAYSGIRARVRTVEDESRLMKLATWSGTTATLGLLELVIHNIERVVGELEDMLKKLDSGVIPNLDEE